MYATERQQHILSLARNDGRVEVAALAESLGVTMETVRRDLTALEHRGALRRVHGGAIPAERLELEPTLATRASLNTAVKRRIAARVLDRLPLEGTVILDAGSTTQSVVELLPVTSRLTILTNSIPAAAALASHPDLTLYVLGGRVRPITGAAVGEWTSKALEDVVVDYAILGTNGFSAARGLTTPDPVEAVAKRAMIRAAREVIVATDSSKAGDDHLHRFAGLDEVSAIVTDIDLADDVYEELRAAGPEVERA